MRYLSLICLTLLLGSCGNRLKSLEQAGQKVTKTVNVCTEFSNGICPRTTEVVIRDKKKQKDVLIDIGFSTVWDAHMMLR